MADAVKVSESKTSTEIYGNLVRQILFTAGGALVTKGTIDAETLNMVIGAMVTIGTSLWSLYRKFKDVGIKKDLAEQVIVQEGAK